MERREFLMTIGTSAAALGLAGSARGAPARPNILWVLAEDMSPHMGCYGETTIQTPNIDRLAREGALFKRAFITCPVCSPSRSAMVTGMYQTTLGAHLHRSSRSAVQIPLPDHVRLIPRYFQQAGYFTTNGTLPKGDPKQTKAGKTDYNFAWDKRVYDGADWRLRKPGQPFFAQIQLRGGKNRGAKVPHPVEPAAVKLPPYYPDHPVLREDWARYLNSIIQTDVELGQILQRLDDDGLADSTVVFFWTDHGISHVRDKQFLYEGGIHIPLIVRGPGVTPATARDDLVEHIDIPATSLALAGMPVPPHLQGRALFAPDYVPRDAVFAARDRCDETVERIRCVRTARWKLIRNFHPERPHAQHNRYKDHKPITIVMRRLFAQGKLAADQARPFLSTRPVEELYDLEADPHELRDLADSPQHRDVLKQLRARLTAWIVETRDLGQLPEPHIAELLGRYPSAWAILQDARNQAVAARLRKVGELAEQGKSAVPRLIEALADEAAPVRYRAAQGLGNLRDSAKPATDALGKALADPDGATRVAAARALCFLGAADRGLPVLRRELRGHANEVVRHYAARALEDVGKAALPALDDLKAARSDRYEYVRRVAARTVALLEGAYDPEKRPLTGRPRKRK